MENIAAFVSEDGKKGNFCKDCDHFINKKIAPPDAGFSKPTTIYCEDCAITFDAVYGATVSCGVSRAHEYLCGKEGRYWIQTTGRK